MDRLSFNNSNHGVGGCNMRHAADACLEKGKEKEDSGECRNEWGELLQQTKSRSKDGFANYTNASSDATAETSDGEWRSRCRQSAQFCYL